MKPVILIRALLVALVVMWMLQLGLGRQLLWRTIQVCALDHWLSGAALPCLVVRTKDRDRPGYAILRSPMDRSHVVLAPTVPVIGIEAPQLRQPGAANYIALAWSNRRLADPDGLAPIATNQTGLAINSQRGRTQDQLHIHIDCALATVTQRLADLRPRLKAGRWFQIHLVAGEEPYSAMALGERLDNVNVVDLSAAHLNLSEREMPLLTLAVFANRDDPVRPDFVLLARKDFSRQHAELLLDHDCKDHRRRRQLAGQR